MMKEPASTTVIKMESVTTEFVYVTKDSMESTVNTRLAKKIATAEENAKTDSASVIKDSEEKIAQ